jgi:hypothetical protein
MSPRVVCVDYILLYIAEVLTCILEVGYIRVSLMCCFREWLCNNVFDMNLGGKGGGGIRLDGWEI